MAAAPTAPVKAPVTPASPPPVLPTPQAPARTYTGADGQVHDQNGNTYAAGTTPNTATGDTSNPGTVISPAGASPAPLKPAPAVYSAKSATDFTHNTIVPAIQNGMNGIATQNEKNSQNDLTRFLPGETTDQYNARVASVKAAKGDVPPPVAPTPQDAAAKQIADTPEPGHTFQYAPDGTRHEVPLGTALAQGWSTSAPANPTLRGHTPVVTYNAENGQSVAQYSDGSYGLLGLDGTYQGPATLTDFNNAKASDPSEVMKSITAGIASLKNGPLPLSAPQQAQIDALNANLGIAVAAQVKANSEFTGGTTVAVNLYGMGNSVSGLGLIKSTVDSGIAKIFDLQTKAASTIAQMEEAFNKDNLSNMYQFYSAYQANLKAIDDHITALHTFAFQQKQHADQEADNLRTFNNTVQQQAITNKREDALAASTLATQALDRKKLALEIKALKENPLESIPGGSVLAANGQPDPLKQKAYLQTIAKQNPGLALTIKAAAEYRLPLTARFFATKAGQAFSQQMLQYDPTWDATNYAAKQATVTSFTSGKYSQQITAFNTALSHVGTLESSIATLGNTPVPGVNFLKNAFGKHSGTNSPAGAKLAIAGVTGEMAAAFKASGATDPEIKALGTIDENSSPQDVQRYIKASVALLNGKLESLNSTYVAGVGKPPDTPLLSPHAVAALSDLKNKGYDIKVPGVIYTDPVAFQKHDPQAAQKMDAARSMLIANGMPPTPENILQAAQLADQ